MIRELIEEFEITIDDIRWYLSHNMMTKIKEYITSDPYLLVEYISKGRLEIDLYDMVDKFQVELEEDYQKGYLDESYIRDIFQEILQLKSKRR
ncbi:hypothetical protein [Spirochaeta cellobiosiphila]|uniref:hypothetical protein n=1 Tax=Spirochaeta cellobiosiphila TaxID=504483 RepID=UPI000415E5CC|nr:hypothetical protein [Spirochaeta cellobiosiphila]